MATTSDISGHDAIVEAATPRLDSMLVKSAFLQLKSTDAEIQAGIAEVVARQLAADEATTVALGGAAADLEGGEGGAPIPVISDTTTQGVAEVMDSQPEVLISRETESTSLPSGAETFTTIEEVTEPVAPEPQVLEPAVEVAEPETAEYQEEAVPEVVLSDEAVSQESPQQVATPKTTAPNNTAPQQPAMPGLEALMNASPEQIAAMMAYLQTLQAAKSPAAPAETTTHKAPAEQQKVPESVVPETTTPASSGAEAVATMTQPAEPAQQEPDTSQAVSETSGREPTPTESAILEPVEAESDFVVDPIPDPPSSDEDAVLATTQEAERLHQSSELIGTAPESDFIVDPIPDSPTSEDDSAMATTPGPERLHQSSEVIGTASEPLAVPESLDSAELVGAPEQTNTLESAVAADHAVGEQEGESSSLHDSLDPAEDEASSVDRSLSSVIDQELEKRDREEHAEQLAENEDATLEALGEAGDELLDEAPEPSRLPRNVAAYYLQPLRRVAEYGVPACDLQLRSYSIRPLESFCDFALRAAYYLGLPAYGPVPLPKIIERWTVPKSSFIFKKSQENFERITRRRLIQIKDAHPETVQIWLAFLQKHQQAAVGMKANIWEFSSIGKLLPPYHILCISVSDANTVD